MSRPLSNDLRERVVAAVQGGERCRSAAARFGVAVSSVVKWCQRYRATGSVRPGKMGGHRKPVLEPVVSRIFRKKFLAERCPSVAQAVSGSLVFCSKISMFRYRLADQLVPAMWRSLAAARLRQDVLSGKAPTTRVRRLISRMSRSSGLFVLILRQCSSGKA